MEVVDAACVVEADLGQEQRLNVRVAERTDDPCRRTDEHGNYGSLDKVRHCSHCHAACIGNYFLRRNFLQWNFFYKVGHCSHSDAACQKQIRKNQ